MHPLFNQQLAKQHTEKLQCEAELARRAALVHESESRGSHSYHLNFLHKWYDMTRLLYRRPVVLQKAQAGVVNLEEIKPVLLATFSVMHEGGLVSEYDDCFVEKFIQTFEQELAHQSACKCSTATI